MRYYRVNKVGEDRLENADQLIADDIEKFADAISEIYSNALKPIVDFFLFSFKLGSAGSFVIPAGMYVWFAIASTITTMVFHAII